MSTERPDDNEATGTRRRPRLAAVSVAAAVLLAGGGGAWWATTAADGTAVESTAAAPGRSVPPLALDATGAGLSPAGGTASEGADAGAADSGGTASGGGFAPGEPDPGSPVYRASGELPEGPESAAVHRATGSVGAAEVARLARALGVGGTPRAEGSVWRVGSAQHAEGPYLQVTREAPGTWTFAADGSGGLSPCPSGAMCANGAGAASGAPEPVDERTAKAAAAPVLKAVGQSGAALNAGQLMGPVRVVNADPVADGLPTYGWSTGVQIGPDGDVVGGSGQLKALTEGAQYPVLTAAETLDRLNATAGAPPDPGGCATPAPLEGTGGAGKPSAPQCVPSAGRPAPVLTVEDAVFGLALRYEDGRRALVPSWLFQVRAAPGGPLSTVDAVAVEPEHLETPREPSPSGGGKVTSYTADGRSLKVTFWGGVCADYSAAAKESAGQVSVTVTERRQSGDKACVMIAKELERTVELDAPLGGRTVVDAATGHAVPRV
ncbi:hypothetical protein [uncultured Streptomyces sp.]|uniref:hypothetical protein n=1 Tax=uncultured Streptomyces sp. TaxID=174707 RepID=UPI002606E833|nr:hypothetical protein [uncultured Streptomyces sp.]